MNWTDEQLAEYQQRAAKWRKKSIGEDELRAEGFDLYKLRDRFGRLREQLERRLVLTIPEIGPSSNTIYAGLHFRERKRIADHWHAMIGSICKRERIRAWAGAYPVVVTCRCYFAGRKVYDSDNLSFTCKLVTDGLVLCKVLAGDSLRYVSETRLASRRAEGRESYTVYEVSSE